MPKYQLLDNDGGEVGFVVVNQSEPQFQHTAPTFPADGPMSDAVLFLTVLGGFSGVAWFAASLAGVPAWLGPAAGLVLTAGLAGVRAWRSGPVDGGALAGDELTIKVESWTDEGHVLLDEIRDKSISLEDWRKVAGAIVKGSNFSRPSLCSAAGISQTTYHKIVAEFERLNFAHKAAGNRTILSPRALAFLRKIDALPQ